MFQSLRTTCVFTQLIWTCWTSVIFSYTHVHEQFSVYKNSSCVIGMIAVSVVTGTAAVKFWWNSLSPHQTIQIIHTYHWQSHCGKMLQQSRHRAKCQLSHKVMKTSDYSLWQSFDTCKRKQHMVNIWCKRSYPVCPLFIQESWFQCGEPLSH